MRTLLFLTLFPFCGTALTSLPELPKESRVPGGIFTLPIDAPPDLRPTVLFQGSRTLVVRNGDRWLAVVGIPLSAVAGRTEVLVQAGVEPGIPVAFDIAGKEYESQHLKVAPGQVNLSKTNLARVERERLRIQGAMATYSDEPPSSLRLQPPVPGRRSSSYGLRRFFNNESRNPHSGMDIAA